MTLLDTTIPRQFDRLPPNSIEAESCLIGALMMMDEEKDSHFKATWARVKATVTVDSFFQADHSVLFKVLKHLSDEGHKIDPMIVRDELGNRQLLDDIGGVEYLAEILHTVPNSANAVEYADIVRQKAMLRALVSQANDTIRRCYGPLGDTTAEEIAMGVSARAARIATTGRTSDVYRIGDVAAEVFVQKDAGTSKFIETGLRDLDRLIGGLLIGGKTIVGAKAGMGKSALIKQIALNVAGCGTSVGIISIEESRYKIAENALSNRSGVVNNRISFGRLTEFDWGKFATAVAELSNTPIFIVDSARKLSSIIAAAHGLHAEHGCKVIAVDHLHIVDGECDANREREISKISAELKWVWKDMGVAGIEAAQLNRGSGRDRPSNANLRDSGSLEQDADTVALLHREDYYRTGNDPHDNILEIIIAKNKNGAPGTVPARYDGARQRVGNLEPEDPFGEEAA
jgi:replicative DNA helicase